MQEVATAGMLTHTHTQQTQAMGVLPQLEKGCGEVSRSLKGAVLRPLAMPRVTHDPN